MALMSQRLDLRQSQSLVMTPQLQQAIKLLQLSNLELQDFVEQELEENPLLERQEGPEGSDTGEPGGGPGADAGDSPADSAESGGEGREPDGGELMAVTDYAPDGDSETPYDEQYENLYSNESPADLEGAPVDRMGLSGMEIRPVGGGRTDFSEDDRGVEQILASERTLREHLLEQIGMDLEDPVDRAIASYLVDALDENGWLPGPLDGAAGALGCDVGRIEETLARLRHLEPSGVFARDLRDCLAMQLAERDRLDPAMEILLDNLPLLAQRDAKTLMRLCGVDEEDLSDMAAEIRALNPRPASAFDHVVAEPVTPDILMRTTSKGGWAVELNNETLPRVLVNTRYYAEVARSTRKREDKEYLSERYNSANWLVKSLHQRANTILKVAAEIVRQQTAFFHKGVHHLRPLILRDIAEAIEMHESTVSRVTTNKYLATPRGVFELKYFFTAAIPATGNGATHSAEAVRHRIKTMIDAEQTNAILSDDKIVEILREDGVDIARRTVAKYREAMRIPSSVQRRREKSAQI